VPAGGFGSTPSLSRIGYKSPNEKLNIASIGAGGRATVDIAGCASENIVALADPDDKSAAPSYKLYDKATRYRDFRRMLDKEGNNIDAVIVCTPDHTHAAAAMWCMERGKHVYVEKPLAHTIWETHLLTEAAAKYKVATQMGNQGYSYEGNRVASEIIWSGELGNIREVHGWTDRPIWPQGIDTLPPEEKIPDTLDWDVWLGPAAARPYSSAYVPFNWRGWFDFGTGAFGDAMCHSLGSTNMALKLGAPTSVEVIKRDGKNPYTYPKKTVTRFDFSARGALGPVKIFWYDGSTGPTYMPPGMPDGEPFIGGTGSFGANGAVFTGGLKPLDISPEEPSVAQRTLRNGAVFVGENGYMTSDGYGANIRLLPLSRHKDYKLPAQLLTRSPGHYRDWIRAAKGGEAACSNFSIAGPFIEWALLGAIAVRCEGKLEWDSARMKVTNSAEANAHLRPKLRKGWQFGHLAS
jgi:predicted dehydrogenase